MTAFDPRQIGGLLAWFRADTLGLSNGGAVSAWPDSSGNGNTAVQATGAKQPIFTTGAMNGLPVVRFTHTNAHVMATAAFGSSVPQPTTILIAVAITAAGNNNDIADSAGTANRQNLANVGNSLRLYAGGATASGSLSFNTAPVIYSVIFNNTSSLAFRNGAADYSGATGVGTGPLDGVSLGGGNPVGSTTMDGDFAEYLAYRGQLSTADRRRLEAYLGKKLAIAVI